MKLPSFQIANLQDALLRHIEKFVVAALGMLALFIAWGGVHALIRKSVQPNHTPESIAALTSETVRHIDAPKEPSPDLIRSPGGLAKALEPWRPKSLKVSEPPPATVLSRPFTQDIVKRPKPEVFPIEDLRAIAGVAIIPDAAAAAVGDGGPAVSDDAGRRRRRLRPGQSSPAGEPSTATEVPDGQPAAEDLPGRVMPYVIVTGLVPVTKQRDEFTRCFNGKGLQDPQRDQPHWGQYAVERTLVTGGTLEKWERLRVANVQTLTIDAGAPLQSGGQEPLQDDRLPPTFLLNPSDSEIAYVSGLPQLLYGVWGTKAVHPWFLPELRKLMARQIATVEEPAAVAMKDLVANPTSFLNRVVKVSGVRFKGDTVPQPAAGVFVQTVSDMDDSVSCPAGDIGDKENLVFVRTPQLEREFAPLGGIATDTKCDAVVRIEKIGRTPVARLLSVAFFDSNDVADGDPIVDVNPFPLAPTGEGTPGTTGAEFADGGSEFRLFRFLDRSVKTGATYRYRVRFTLMNPNYGLEPRYLEDAAAAKSELLVSAASNDTAAVTVPDSSLVLIRTLGKEEAKAMKLRKDSVELLVLAPKNGVGNLRFSRVITEPGGAVNADPALNTKSEIRVRGDNRFDTGRTVVDFRGRLQEDDPAKSGPREMVEALLLRRDGSLEVVSYADSEPMFERYRHTLPVAVPPVDEKRPSRPVPAAGAGGRQ